MSITMTTVILFAVFGVLLFLGVPISISIVASSIVTAMSTLSWDQITFITMQKMNSGVESFSLLAVPLFILAGNIMNNGGIAKRLVNFAQLFVGQDPRLHGAGQHPGQRCCSARCPAPPLRPHPPWAAASAPLRKKTATTPLTPPPPTLPPPPPAC